jgi:hypothetical protein
MRPSLPETAFIGITKPYIMSFALCTLIPDFQINSLVISLLGNPFGRFDYSEKREGRYLAAFDFVMINAGF